MQGNARSAHRRRKREIWQKHLDGWKRSGQTQAAYCRQHGLKPKSFTYWKRRLKKTEPAVRLVQLPSETLRTRETVPVRVVVDERFAIEVSDGFNPATLGGVLEVFRGL